MLTLRKYAPSDFHYLSSWVTDADLLFQFAGPDWSFPLTEEQLSSYQQKFLYKQFYIGLHNDIPFAFGEIIWNETVSPRLGRLLVGGETNRGKGLGQQFIQLLIEECKMLFNADAIHLFVLENNKQAIACYLKCGFVFAETPHFTLPYKDENYKVLKMTMKTN
jgi:RimJ/RimL family protein N-acetyltransferase